MRILAFDTATDATTVAFLDPGKGIELELRDDPPAGERPGHATRLLPMIAEVLERTGGGWEGVERIAVGIGPGTFTGLRIGVATARALAHARELPLVGISSLQALAWGAIDCEGEEGPGGRIIVAAIDARRGEVFAAAWRGRELELEQRAASPDALARAVGCLAGADATPPLAIGDGALRFRAQLEVAGAAIPPFDSRLHRISAINHCRLAAGVPATAPGEVEPAYLRAPDAEIAYRERYPGPK